MIPLTTLIPTKRSASLLERGSKSAIATTIPTPALDPPGESFVDSDFLERFSNEGGYAWSNVWERL